jgi:hypothetical protein
VCNKVNVWNILSDTQTGLFSDDLDNIRMYIAKHIQRNSFFFKDFFKDIYFHRHWTCDKYT